ncbi:MAG: VWA domain-containing protein [Anaerolineales bacterium]|nr:VWA domain-containing protein [Anaerolineales bacterium]
MIPIQFARPLFLLLLVVLPLAAFLGWPGKGLNRRREIVSLILRLVILTCVILALAGPEIARQSDKLAVVFLLDHSDSMSSSAQRAAEAYIQKAVSELGEREQAAVVVFGSDALVERPISSATSFEPVTSLITTNQTDLAEAVQLALALFPADAAHRIVILSDGGNTTGDALAAARLAATSNAQILYVPFQPEAGAEVSVSDVEAPANLHQGETFDLSFTLTASEATQAAVRVLADGEIVHSGNYDLDRGTHTYTIPLEAGEPGFVNYEVLVSANGDTFYQNNELDTFSRVSGPPRVLVVAPPAGEAMGFRGETRPDEYSALVQVLENANILYDLAIPSGLPSELPLLAEYASVILVDVPAREFNQRQLTAVQSYVRDLGGGLIVIGGPTAYGVGGYYRTALEETLPVEMQLKDEARRPSIALVFVIDRSGSMSDTSGGMMKIELAKEAAMRSVELMAPFDQVGVIVFDEEASWAVPMTEVGDYNQVIDAIGSIRSGGGTDILAGVQAMANVLPDVDATVRHVILLTDGGASQTGIPQLVESLNQEYGITLTTVGVGYDAAPFLPELAEIGGGRYYFAGEPSSVPSIFTEETTLATRSYIIEEVFYPQLLNPSPILSGITEVPPLYGYVGTSAKAAARTILVSHQEDPILASWQYGLGRAVAFTSDASGRWAKDWIGWDGYATFWAQAVNYVNSQPTQSTFDVSVDHEDEVAHLSVTAFDENGDYLNDYTLEANVVYPDGETQTVELHQVASGEYAGDFVPTSQGTYVIGVAANSPDAEETEAGTITETAGWVLTYSPEYRATQANVDLLRRMAELTGGGLAPAEPAALLNHDLPAPRTSRPIWSWLLVIAAVLLPLDVAVRRLVVTWADARVGLSKLSKRLSPRPAAQPETVQRSERLSALFEAKQRAQDEQPEETSPAPPQAQEPKPKRQPVVIKHPPTEDTTPKPSAAEITQRKPTASPAKTEGSTTSYLLSRKRAREKEDAEED